MKGTNGSHAVSIAGTFILAIWALGAIVAVEGWLWGVLWLAVGVTVIAQYRLSRAPQKQT